MASTIIWGYSLNYNIALEAHVYYSLSVYIYIYIYVYSLACSSVVST